MLWIVLFDTGGHTIFDKVFTDRCKDLESELERLGCKPGNLKLIVLTLGDIDHVANVVFLREKYQTKIAMHERDLRLVEDLTIEKMMESFKFRSIIFKIIFRFMKKSIKKISSKMLADFKTFKPDVLMDEGDSLSECGFDAKVLHIPGHTEGSIGILTANGDLIAGDIFMNFKKPDLAPNAYDFKIPATSVNRLKAMNINMIYPGHGLPLPVPQARESFLWQCKEELKNSAVIYNKANIMQSRKIH